MARRPHSASQSSWRITECFGIFIFHLYDELRGMKSIIKENMEDKIEQKTTQHKIHSSDLFISNLNIKVIAGVVANVNRVH